MGLLRDFATAPFSWTPGRLLLCARPLLPSPLLHFAETHYTPIRANSPPATQTSQTRQDGLQGAHRRLVESPSHCAAFGLRLIHVHPSRLQPNMTVEYIYQVIKDTGEEK